MSKRRMSASVATKKMLTNKINYDTVKNRMKATYMAESKKYRNKVAFLEQEDLDKKETELVGKYFKYIVDKGQMLTRKAVKEADTIDLTSLLIKDGAVKSKSDLPAYKQTEEEEEYIKSHPFCIVPPMEKGVIKVNGGRYFVFDVLDLNVDEHSYKLYLEDYAKDQMQWMMNSSTVANIRWSEGTIVFEDEAYAPLSEIFGMTSPLNMDFTEDEKLFWKRVIIPDIMLIDQMDEDEGKPHPINNYLWCVVKTNMELGKNKLHTKRSSGNKTDSTIEASVEKRKKQLIRNVGESGISIRSVDIPREANYERIIRYKVASWNTRGHERKLKSGKIVYVKPSVHHRKALQGKCTDDPAQTVIQID